MRPYKELSRDALLREKEKVEKEYREFKAKNLKLDMSRGKPGKDQLDLAMPMMDIFNSSSSMKSANGTDVRNYGIVDGIPEAKKLMGDMMGAPADQTIVYGNSSLNIMYDQIARCYMFGACGNTPWGKLDKIKFLCPVPGYDRHFGVTQQFGIEMINIEMNEDGPNMDKVEDLVSKDESIKGIWCVPKYSNPGGVVYSDEVVRRLASMKPLAKDFRIFWDNAYVIHYLYRQENLHSKILNILDECKKAGNEDMVFQFASTSKISFPGAGVAAMSSSKNNIKDIKNRLKFQTIGHDKINQLRHVKFFKNYNGLVSHMMKHSDLLRPKFEATLDILKRELGPLEISSWTKPLGGYFISFNAMNGCAKNIVKLCKDAGVTLTGAGAAFPYKKDPNDSNIRLAPSLPPVKDIKMAMTLFSKCVKLASVQKLLGDY
ncbi:MAG: aminotransferase [archaeon]|nr:aminotransferase [archaeon]